MLQEQHPELARLRLIATAEGWDNVTFRLGDALAVRVPRRAIAANLVVNEQRWLPHLAPRLSLPIPVPTHVGLPSTHFPWHWSVVPWIAGRSALESPLGEVEAGRLAKFLRELHTIAIPAEPPRNRFRGVHLATRAAGLEGALKRLRAVHGTTPAGTPLLVS
jgi:aminoglycoside phosphotransferase (APT) family kinase protein